MEPVKLLCDVKRFWNFLRRKWLDLPLWQKLFVGLFILMLLIRVMFTEYLWRHQREASTDAIDKELLLTCFEAVPIFGDHLHDNLPYPPPDLTEEAYRETTLRLTDLARDTATDTDAVYTAFRSGDDYVFGIGSIRMDEEGHPVAHVHWGEKWITPPTEALQRAYQERRAVAETYFDEGGHFRSVFVPVLNDDDEIYIICADIEIPSIERQIYADMAEGATLGVVLLVVSIGMVLLTWAGVSRPLRRVVAITRGLIDRDFQAREEDALWLEKKAKRGQDEIGKLAGSVLTMQNALSVYVEHIREVAIESGRVDAEMQSARGIQLSLLPKPFAERYDDSRVSVAGLLEPAGDVGGDFFDYTMRDENHLYFVVGDVAGRGIPSAMLMAMARTQLRTLVSIQSTQSLAPADMIREVNRALKYRDCGGLFVSLLCAVLDLRTGKLRYANGGLHKPLLLPRGGGTRELGNEVGPPAGVPGTASWSTHEETLTPGDTVVLYTNGVLWCRDANGESYGVQRLSEAVMSKGTASPDTMNQAVFRSLLNHIRTEPQVDDVTLLTVRFNGMS